MTTPKEAAAALLLILAAIVVGAKKERDRVADWFWGQKTRLQIIIGVSIIAFFTLSLAFLLKDVIGKTFGNT